MGCDWNMCWNLNTWRVFWMNQAECRWKVASGGSVAGAIRSRFSSRGLQLECTSVLHETMLVPVLRYGSETCYGRKGEVWD